MKFVLPLLSVRIPEKVRLVPVPEFTVRAGFEPVVGKIRWEEEFPDKLVRVIVFNAERLRSPPFNITGVAGRDPPESRVKVPAVTVVLPP